MRSSVGEGSLATPEHVTYFSLFAVYPGSPHPDRYFRSWPTVILVTQSLLMSPFIMIPGDGHHSAEEPSDRLMSPLVGAIQWSPVSRLLGLISADNQMSWSVIIMPGQLPHHHYPVSEYQSITVSSVPDSLHLSTCQTIVSPYLSTLSTHFNSPLVSDWLK